MRTLSPVLLALAIGGCSAHPLTEDTTGLSSEAIVHKVRCEAQDAVKDIAVEQKIAHLHKGLSEANEAIKDARSALKKNERNTREAKELALVRARLIAIKAENELAHRSVKNKINKLILETGDPDTPAPDWLKAELKEVQRRLLLWEDRAVAYRRRVNALNARIDVALKRIELGEQKRDKEFEPLIKLYSHQTAMAFRFQITENRNATLGGTLGWPIHLGSLTLDVGAGDLRERYAERTVKLSASFGALVDVKGCAPEGDGRIRHFAGRYPIQGKIGLDEVLRQYLKVAKGGKFTKQGESFIDEIQFTTTVSAKAAPEFSITRAPKRTVSGDIDLSISRKDQHEVIVYLAPQVDDPGADKVTYVRILEDSADLGPAN